MLRAPANLAVYFHVRSFILIVLTVVKYNPSAYNINARDAKVFPDPVRASGGHGGNYFGFSVALYAGADASLLLVGAPRANSSFLPFVMEPGTVFKCWMNGVCEEWPVDKTGNRPYSFNTKISQIKNNAWIGATIAVENKTEARVVVCAPRWIRNIRGTYNKLNWYVNGICYATLVSNVSAFEREATQNLMPFWEPNYQIVPKNYVNVYYYGMAQIGFSIHMISRHTTQYHVDVVLGSPGTYNWQGDVVLMTAKGNGSFLKPIIPSLEEKRLHSFNYFGYAVTAGTYFSENTISYASSAPRYANGTVIVFDFPSETNQTMNIRTIVYGQVYGEYFGAALTSCDVNNDRRQELIVGAPFWAKDMDEGHVYIYTVRYTSTRRYKNNFKEMQKIPGEIFGGRFGSSVMCLGDIDYDGYGDIAVGAPYEEETGGAVYIFNGNRDGVSRRYSQRLIGREFSPVMRGFGISISEPRDVDGDNHSDIAVGAYLSGDVVLLKSLPVVTVNVTLSYPQRIKLLRNTTFFINLWMSYEGAYVPECLRVIAILQIDQLYGRAAYQAQSSIDGIHRLPYTLLKSRLSRNLFEIHLAEDIQNIIDPLEISVSMQIDDDLRDRNGNSSCVSRNVAVNNASQTEHLIRLPFAVECGEDDVCVADLGVKLSTHSTEGDGYVIGSTSTIPLRIDAYNRGEPAYRTRVRVHTGILTLANIPPECVESSSAGGNLEVICDIGNPLRTNKTLTLQLDTSTLRYDVMKVELWANISTQSDEANWIDNNYAITVHFDADIDIAIVGKAQENLYSYSREDEEKPPSSIRFQHFYEVQKFGVSPIEEAVLTVKVPTHIRRPNGDVAIVEVSDIIGFMNGFRFYCNDITNQSEVFIASSEEVLPRIVASSSVADDSMNASMYESRALYVNCSSNAVQCGQIDCTLGPFLSSLSVARFLVTLDLQLPNFPADTIKDKDIIYYVTEGRVTITQPFNIVQKKGHKPDATSIATTFVGSPVAQKIAVWIITVSVVLGIVLLILLILALVKIGFFNRKKKLELEALKAETDKKYNVVLETTSSKEALDQD